jgi:hypothetical protein
VQKGVLTISPLKIKTVATKEQKVVTHALHKRTNKWDSKQGLPIKLSDELSVKAAALFQAS